MTTRHGTSCVCGTNQNANRAVNRVQGEHARPLKASLPRDFRSSTVDSMMVGLAPVMDCPDPRSRFLTAQNPPTPSICKPKVVTILEAKTVDVKVRECALEVEPVDVDDGFRAVGRSCRLDAVQGQQRRRHQSVAVRLVPLSHENG